LFDGIPGFAPHFHRGAEDPGFPLAQTAANRTVKLFEAAAG